jgi:hypothetical protein
MTDHELEQRLRAWYRAEITDGETAPAELRAQVASIPRTRLTSVHALRSRRNLTLLAAAAITTALIGGAIAVGSGWPRLTAVVPPAPSPNHSPAPLPSPSEATPSLATPSEATPGGSGAWRVTGKMRFDGWLGAATLLPDGEVLVAGGGGRDRAAAKSAELYSPLTGRWTETGSMHMPRGGGHTATLLPDGRVLVAGGHVEVGGITTGQSTRSAELYDPATGRWIETGNMVQARSHHSATLLLDGKVLVVGGDPDSKSAELYDPIEGTWTATGSMLTARAIPTAALLPDGKVLVVGGAASTGRDLQSAELYDPSVGTWASVKSFQGTGGCRIAAELLDGKVLVVCADENATRTSGALFDPASGTWAAIEAPPAECCIGEAGPQGSIVLLSDGRVLWKDLVDAGLLYDPATGGWASAGGPTYPADRSWGLPYTVTDEGSGYKADTLTLLPGGRVLMTTLNAALVYDPNGGQ